MVVRERCGTPRYPADVGRQVGAAGGDGRGAPGGGETEPEDDPVGVAVGLGGGRPLAKVRVADQQQLVARQVPRDPVRTGGRQRDASLAAGSRGGQHVRVPEGEFVQEVGVRVSEVKRHRACAVVRDDSAREIAGRAVTRSIGARADDRLEVVSGRRAEVEDPLEGVGDVGRFDEPAGRVADRRPQLERVRVPAGGRHGEREGEIGDGLTAVRTATWSRVTSPSFVMPSSCGDGVFGELLAAGSMLSTSRLIGMAVTVPPTVARAGAVDGDPQPRAVAERRADARRAGGCRSRPRAGG